MTRVARLNKFFEDYGEVLLALGFSLGLSLGLGAFAGFLTASLSTHDDFALRCLYVKRGAIVAFLLHSGVTAIYVRAIVLDFLDETRKPPSTLEV